MTAYHGFKRITPLRGSLVYIYFCGRKNNMFLDLVISFHAPLHEKDSEIQTYGCRKQQPDICRYNSAVGVCAFATTDNICRTPSQAWKRQYSLLLHKHDA
jgi:hypothetical protein